MKRKGDLGCNFNSDPIRLIGVLFFFLIHDLINGAAVHFIGDSGGSWNVPNNWGTLSVPTLTDAGT